MNAVLALELPSQCKIEIDAQISPSLALVKTSSRTVLLRPQVRVDMTGTTEAKMSRKILDIFQLEGAKDRNHLCVEARVAQLPRLDEVVLEAHHSAHVPVLEELSQDQHFRRTILGTRTVHEYEYGSDLIKFNVLLCHPFDQGVITDRTNVFVTSGQSLQQESGGQRLSSIYDYPDPLMAGEYRRCSVFALRPQDLQKLIWNRDEFKDDRATAFVPLNLMVQLDVIHGGWIEMRHVRNDLKKRRFLRVHALEDSQCPSKGIYVHSSVYHSFGFDIDRAVEGEVASLPCDIEISVRAPAAKNVTLARVGSPWWINADNEMHMLGSSMNLDEFSAKRLKAYLTETPRLVAVGDVFSVPVNTVGLFGDADEDLEEECVDLGSNLPQVETKYLQYQVISINNSTDFEGNALLDANQTRTEQDSKALKIVVPSYVTQEVPCLETARFVPKAFRSIKTVIRSTGSRIETHVPKTILLAGPQGTPKSQVVESIAAHLGLNLWHINMYEMSGYASSDLATAITDIIDRARHVLPCVLFLEDLQGVSVKPMGAEDESQQSALISRDERMLEKIILEALCKVQVEARKADLQFVVIGTTTRVDATPAALTAIFRHTIDMDTISESSRFTFFEKELSNLVAPDVDLKELARNTSSMDFSQLERLVSHLTIEAWSQPPQVMPNDSAIDLSADIRKLRSYPIVLPRLFDHLHLTKELQSFQKALSKNSRFTLSSVPTTTFADIGGLHDAKREIYTTITLPLLQGTQSPHRRTGILFYGPPGCGKTLLAKAIANELQCAFFSVKGPELMNMYVGETERNVRDVFEKARKAKRAVIFFDELDAMAPRREGEGVMSRVVSQLLAEMDGVGTKHSQRQSGGELDDEQDECEDEPMVFVIGATNRPDLLDPSLLRPGRFDRLVYLETANTHEAQLELLRAVTRKLPLDSTSIDLEALVKRIPVGRWTGADFHALSVDALMRAIGRTVDQLEKAMEIAQVILQRRNLSAKGKGKLSAQAAASMDGDVDAEEYVRKDMLGYRGSLTPSQYLDKLCPHPEKYDICITQEDFVEAINSLKPSVSAAELTHYRRIQSQFRDGKHK